MSLTLDGAQGWRIFRPSFSKCADDLRGRLPDLGHLCLVGKKLEERFT